MKRFVFASFFSVLALGVANGRASAQVNFSGQWASPTNGIVTFVQNGNVLTGSMTGRDDEWWGRLKNKGGNVSGIVNGATAQLTSFDGAGNSATWTITMGQNGATFTGPFRVNAGPLRGAAGQINASRLNAPAANLVWRETESGVAGTFYGTWTWDPARRQFNGQWNNGARAILTVVSDDGRRVVLRRFDPTGVSTSMTAEYVGERVGNSFRGTVTFQYRGGTSRGTWSASW